MPMTFRSLFKLRSQAGFGLLQTLMILLAFTALVLVSVSMMDPVTRPAAANATNVRLDALKAAAIAYRAHIGNFPPDLDALVTATGAACAPDSNPSSPTFRSLRGWCGPYLDREFQGSDQFKRDGWGALLQYNGNTIVSCGANRTCGDGDDISIAL